VPVFSEDGDVEYVPGDLPLLISVGHGGKRTPDEIPDRTMGVSIPDEETDVIGRFLADALWAETGHHAHVVYSRLARSKLDPNRALEEAAEHPRAEAAWTAYHGYLEEARSAITRSTLISMATDTRSSVSSWATSSPSKRSRCLTTRSTRRRSPGQARSAISWRGPGNG
jgi:N-formylglutamate amidohydrolase